MSPGGISRVRPESGFWRRPVAGVIAGVKSLPLTSISSRTRELEPGLTLFTICPLGHTGWTTICVRTFRIFRPRDTGSRSQRITFAAKILRVSFSVFRQCVRSAPVRGPAPHFPPLFQSFQPFKPFKSLTESNEKFRDDVGCRAGGNRDQTVSIHRPGAGE